MPAYEGVPKRDLYRPPRAQNVVDRLQKLLENVDSGINAAILTYDSSMLTSKRIIPYMLKRFYTLRSHRAGGFVGRRW